MARSGFARHGKGLQSGRSRKRDRLAKLISLLGVVATVGTALYRFRREWQPYAKDLKEDVRDRMGSRTPASASD